MTITPHSRRRRRGEVNIVPMIDVLTVLIFFFLLTMQFRDVTVADVNTPNMDSAEKLTKEKPTFISVTQDGSYFLGHEKISIEILGEKFKEISKTDPNAAFVLVMDKSANVEHYINVLDKARLANIKKLSIQANKPKQ